MVVATQLKAAALPSVEVGFLSFFLLSPYTRRPPIILGPLEIIYLLLSNNDNE